MAVHPDQALGEVDPCPRGLPQAPTFFPAADRALDCLARRDQRSRSKTGEPVGMTDRRAGNRVPAGKERANLLDPSLGVVRASRGDQASGAGHNERDEQGPLVR